MTQKIQKISVSEAAKLLKITRTRVLQLIKLETIPAERVGNQFVLRKPDVLAARGRKAGRPRKKPISPEIKPTAQIEVTTNPQNNVFNKSGDKVKMRIVPKASPQMSDYYENNKW